MQSTNIPKKFPIPFGDNAGAGYIRTIPQASQVGITPGAASLNDGFPPLTFQAVGAGGIPPSGQDFNGLLFQATSWDQWVSIGGPVFYDATQSAAVGGYPKWTILANASTPGYGWISTVENNITDPDTGGAGWMQCLFGVTQLDARYLRIPPSTSFYVSPAGTDSNPGTALLPFLTLQGAVNAISSFAAVGNVYVNVANGTYAGFSVFQSFISSWNFIGNTGTPGSCIIQSLTTGVNGGYGVQIQNALVALQGFTIQSYYENVSATRAQVEISAVNLTGTANAFMASAYSNGYILMTGSIGISGNGIGMFQSAGGSNIAIGIDVGGVLTPANFSITGTPSFSSESMLAISVGVISMNNSSAVFTGSATGVRYSCQGNGVINTQGAGASFLPGGTAGTTSSGGQYL